MDCRPPGWSVHVILQAKILEWVAMPSSRESSQSRIELASLISPALAGGFFITSTIWESFVQPSAKSLQSCPTLCDPIDGNLPGSPVPGILQARTLEWVAISFSSAWKWKVKVKSLSRVQLWAIPWTAAYQSLPSIGFSRQEYWSGVPLPSPVQPSIQPLFNVPFFCHWFMVPGGPWAREYYYSVESGWVSCHIELCGPGYLPFPRGRLRVNTEINWLISVMVACVYVSSPFLMSDLEISMLG